MNSIETILGNILIELSGNQRRQIGLGAVIHVDPVDVALKVEPRRRRPTDKLRPGRSDVSNLPVKISICQEPHARLQAPAQAALRARRADARVPYGG